MKFNQDKSPIHLVPPECIIAAADVLAFGAQKYGPNNWREDLNTTHMSENYDSLNRHLLEFWQGENLDPESGKSHLAHAMCQLMFLYIQHTQGDTEAIDDRFTVDMIKPSNKKVNI